MAGVCPIPTNAERAFGIILGEVETELGRQVAAALDRAAEDARR